MTEVAKQRPADQFNPARQTPCTSAMIYCYHCTTTYVNNPL